MSYTARPDRSKETHEFACEVVHYTQKAAICLIGGRKIILPLSQVEFSADETQVTIPEWLVIVKELDDLV